LNNTIASETTEVLYGNDKIVKKTLETFSSIKERLEGSFDNAGPAIHIMAKPIWNGLVQLKEKGVKIRLVTEVTPDNISHCKKLLEVCELRHLDGIRTNFGIADRKELLLHGVSEETNPLSQAIVTTATALVQAQEYLFENLWKNAIPAQFKIKEIEEGVKPPFIETLRDPLEIRKVRFDLIKSAKQEIQMLLHTNNSSKKASRGELKQLIIQLFNIAIAHRIRVRILTSKDVQKQIEELTQEQQKIMRRLSIKEKNEKGGKENIAGESVAAAAHVQGKFEIHLIDKIQQQPQQRLQTKVSILIVDSKVCLIEDLKVYDDNSSDEGLPLATYSNSESTVLTYISIFETLWTQTELNKQSVI
jgi:two-component system, OmpR family, sensor histidine kinase VicK